MIQVLRPDFEDNSYHTESRDEVLDYFVDKIYLDDDGKLSFVLKLYDKDGVTFQKVTEAEIIANSGFTVFDTFVNGSTQSSEYSELFS